MSQGKRRFDEPGGHLGRNCHRLYLTEDKALGCVTHRPSTSRHTKETRERSRHLSHTNRQLVMNIIQHVIIGIFI